MKLEEYWIYYGTQRETKNKKVLKLHEDAISEKKEIKVPKLIRFMRLLSKNEEQNKLDINKAIK